MSTFTIETVIPGLSIEVQDRAVYLGDTLIGALFPEEVDRLRKRAEELPVLRYAVKMRYTRVGTPGISRVFGYTSEATDVERAVREAKKQLYDAVSATGSEADTIIVLSVSRVD